MNLKQVRRIKQMQVVEQERCREAILETCTVEQILEQPHLKAAMGW